GWFAKFAMFSATIGVGNWWGYSIAIVAAINAVIAFVYYAKVIRATMFDQVPDGVDIAELEAKTVPGAAGLAVGIAVVGVILLGVFPGIAADLGQFSTSMFTALGG
ncbi:hypothetical protein MNBD_ACTINO01-1262, partial [hydrothermal vent metagenome]